MATSSIKLDQLGRLEEVKDLRSIWPDEARDFTPWLSQLANIAILEEALGISLEVQGIEKEVGPYRADLVCLSDRDRRVVIENQLFRTDHGHLGQLLTYAAHLEARVLVWIAKEFTDEHRAVIDWLNTNTRDNVEFFALQIQLWKIGESAIAPRFNVVCRPNNWTRTVEPPASEGEAGPKHLRFWKQFNEHIAKSQNQFRTTKPSTSHWTDIAIGRSGVHLTLLNRWGRDSVFMIYLSGPSKAAFFRQLHDEHLDLLTGVLNSFGAITWREMADRKSAVLQVSRAMPPDDEASWTAVIEWFQAATNATFKHLKPTLMALRTDVGLPTDVIEDDDDVLDAERQAAT